MENLSKRLPKIKPNRFGGVDFASINNPSGHRHSSHRSLTFRNIQAKTPSGSRYVCVQLSWPTPGSSVNSGCPPALRIASIIARDSLGETDSSFKPCTAQIGMLESFSAVADSPPPQIGTAAANHSGRRAASAHVPYPPIESPVTYTRRRSTRGFFRHSSSKRSTASSLPIQLSPFGHCGAVLPPVRAAAGANAPARGKPA